MERISMRWRLLGLVAVLAGLLTACGVSIPADPNGTLNRVTGGTLRVGVSPNPPWTEVSQGGEPTGSEVALVKEFAATLPAEVSWTVGGEEALITAMEHGGLDLVIGGLTADTPWEQHAAITKPYAEGTGPDGNRIKLVMAAPPGENAFLVRLEKFLLSKGQQ
jgi:polar amino acid transport system substrate-binding protein